MKVRIVFPQIWFRYANRVGSGTGRRSGSYTSCHVVAVLRSHTTARNSTLVFDPAALYLHMKSSHGFLMLVCSGLECCCLA